MAGPTPEPDVPRVGVNAPGASRAARNSVLSLARGFLTVPLNLISTAVLLHRAGAPVLGLWAILSVLANPITGFYFGLSWSLARQMPTARHDPDTVRAWVSACATLYGLLIGAFVVGYAATGGSIAAWLASRAGLALPEVSFALACAFASFLCLMLSVPFNALLFGLEEIPTIQTGVAAHQLVVTLAHVALVNGPDTRAIFAPALAGALVQTSWLVVAATRHLGYFPLSLAHVRRRELAHLAREALGISLFELFQLSFYHVDKWLLTAYLGTAAVGFYELGARLAMTLRAILNTVCLPIFSSTATAAASPIAREKLARLFHYANRYLLMISVPLIAAMVLEAPRLLVFWVGRTDPSAVLAVRALAPSYAANALCAGMTFFLLGEGRMRPLLTFAALNLSASWLFSGTTIALTGSFGALLAASLFTSVASCVGLAAYFGRRGLVTRALVVSAARILCVGGIAALLAAPLPVPELAGRAGMAAMVSLRVLFFGGLYLVGLSLTGEWDDQDRYFLSNATGILKPRRED